MECMRLSFEELILNKDLSNLIYATKDDRYTEQDCIEALKHSQIYIIMTGETVIGFYTIDPLGDAVEAHAYILPSQRKFSLSVLRHIINTYPNINTSVYGTHSHVLKFLLKKSFIVTETLEDALVKDGKFHNVWLLSLRR